MSILISVVPGYCWDCESIICVSKELLFCFLLIQDSFTAVSDWPFWVTWRWFHSWRRTFYWHRRYTRIPDCLLTVGICWEKRAWPCRSNGDQPQDSLGTVTPQIVYCVSGKGECLCGQRPFQGGGRVAVVPVPVFIGQQNRTHPTEQYSRLIFL